MKTTTLLLGALLLMTCDIGGLGRECPAGRDGDLRHWVAARIQGAQEPPPNPGLEVLQNYDAVQKNARFGKPLHLAGRAHERGHTSSVHGLFCHASSRNCGAPARPRQDLHQRRGG